MRVLHVAEPVDGGVVRCVQQLSAHQLARGWQVAVAGPPAGQLPTAVEEAGGRHLEWQAGPRPGPATLGEVVRLARVIDRVRPDVVHLHSSKAGLAGRLVLRGSRPTIFQPHAWSFSAVTGPVRAATLRWERLGARWAHRVVCVSEGERRLAEQVGIHAPLVVLANGVDLGGFPPAGDDDRRGARERLGIDASTPLAVAVGRLHRQKGQRELVRWWPQVAERVPGARLALVGDGPDRADLEAAGAWVVGATDDVRSWLHAADVVVLHSRWEGLALTLLEAMASARSVVGTDIDGMREVVRGDAGALVAFDTAALPEAIAARLVDPALAAREGAVGRARVEAEHDLQTQLDRLCTLTEELA
jgi:glycosyltransferase involved in cell wall biosynthesis